MAKEIWSYGSNSISCKYTISMKRSGDTVTVTASGTIYGNGSSSDSAHDLYAHVAYNVSPSNQTGTTTYASSFERTFGAGKLVVSRPLNKTSIPTSGKTFKVSWSFTNNDAVSYSNCALFLTKSDALSLNSIQSAYEFIGKKGSLNVNKVRYYTETLSVGAGYTANSAPDKVWASKTITMPGKKEENKVTISWSGAKAGTNNSIKSYNLYYKRSKNKTAPTIDNYTHIIPNIKDTHQDVIFSSDTNDRGYYYVCKVVAVSGKNENYNSPISSKSASVKINTEPSAPQVTLDYYQVPSTGGSVKASMLSATDDDKADGQNVTYYYSTSISGNKTPIATLDSIPIDAATPNLYFWSYDGLEFSSSYTTKTVTCMPTTSVSLDVIEESNEGNGYSTNTGDSYHIKYKLIATPSVSEGNIIGKYRYYYKVNNGSWTEFSSETYYDDNTYTISNITAYCNPSDTIYFKVEYYQTIDYSSGNTPSYDESLGYTIPAMPTLSAVYNNNGNNNLSNTSENYFLNYLRLYFTKDTGIDTVVINSPSSTTVYQLNLTSDSPYVVLDTSSLTAGTTYNFEVILKRKNHSTTLKFTKTKILSPNFGTNILLSSKIFRPHLTTTEIANIFNDGALGNNSSFTIKFSNVMGFDGTNNNLYKYGLSTENETIKGLQLKVASTNGEYTFPQSDQKFTLNTNSYGDGYLGTTIDATTLISLFNSLGITKYNGQHSLTFSLIINTNYNTSTTSKDQGASPDSFSVDFDVPFNKLNQSFSMEYKAAADGAAGAWKQITNNTLLRRGDKIKYNYSWTTYNSYDINFTAKINRTNSPSIPSTGWVNDLTGTFSFSTSNTLVPAIGVPATGTFSLERTISTITESKYLFFSIVGTQNNSAKELTSSNYAISVQHNQAKIQILNGIYSSGKISFDSICEDSGLKSIIPAGDGVYSATVSLEYDTNEDFSTVKKLIINNVNYSNLETTTSMVYNTPSGEEEVWKGGANFYYVRLKITTVDSGESAATKEENTYSEHIVIYNTTPTISYRQNCLGINYKLPVGESDNNILSNVFLVIGETSGKNQIYFVSSDGINALSGGTWDINLE